MNEKILIVGYGVVGHNLYKELEKLKPDIYDKYKPEFNTKRDIKYDFCFICVDTPYIDETNPCDTKEVINAISENDADIYILKSTVLPGTTHYLNELFTNLGFNKQIVFSPEYYGGTQHCNNFEFNFTIIGGEGLSVCSKVQQLLQYVYDGRHTFHLVDSATAELAKYMENCWLATKVSFCTQFYEIAKNCNVDYGSLRELFILDPRVNPSHTFVYKSQPYWDSHCLNKDVKALAESYPNTDFLKSVVDFNEKQKSNK